MDERIKYKILVFALKEFAKKFNLEFDAEFPEFFVSQTLAEHIKNLTHQSSGLTWAIDHSRKSNK